MKRKLLLALYDRSGLGAYLPVDYKGHELKVDEHMEKFAEMIVRECINRVRSRQQFATEDNQNVTQAFDLLVYDIESHFGVEE